MNDLKKRAEAMLVQCGPHDFGLTMSCSCPEGDYRPVLSQLLRELEQVEARNARQADTIAEVDATNVELSGRLRTAEEQLAAATLEGQP